MSMMRLWPLTVQMHIYRIIGPYAVRMGWFGLGGNGASFLVYAGVYCCSSRSGIVLEWGGSGPKNSRLYTDTVVMASGSMFCRPAVLLVTCRAFVLLYQSWMNVLTTVDVFAMRA